ncbi:uncharacterized protein LOC115213306 [Octopus sinensis]|uniref:Uncharacterized protein LOC115213306 n=1 Tax=Octopus sinensis TaxID=2607531 RepID=A0A6P7SI68_9MOLL|nr:uncharacterized protein LOC115213306 [Octopus sinensis]
MESHEDEPRSGRPASASTDGSIDCVHHMVMNDRGLTINQIANVVRMPREKVEYILHNELGIITSRKNQTFFGIDPGDVLECFLNQDECWVRPFEPETKRQAMQWEHPSSLALKRQNYFICKDGNGFSLRRSKMHCVYGLFSERLQYQWRLLY